MVVRLIEKDDPDFMLEIFGIVKKVIDKHDPYHLIRMEGGGLSDEHDQTCLKIVDAIGREGPCGVHELASVIRFAFKTDFDAWSFPKMPAMRFYMPVAKELWQELPEECRRHRKSST